MTMIVNVSFAVFLVLFAIAIFIYWLKQHKKGEKKPILIGLVIIYIAIAIVCIAFNVVDNRNETTTKAEIASSTVTSYSIRYKDGKNATFVPMYSKKADTPLVLLINTSNINNDTYSFKLENGATIVTDSDNLNVVRVNKNIKPYIKYKRYKAKYANGKKNKQYSAKVTLYEASDKMIKPQ